MTFTNHNDNTLQTHTHCRKAILLSSNLVTHCCFHCLGGQSALRRTHVRNGFSQKNINNSGIFNLHLSCSTFALFLLGKKCQTSSHFEHTTFVGHLFVGCFPLFGDRLTRPDKPVATVGSPGIMAPAMKWMAKKTTESTLQKDQS